MPIFVVWAYSSSTDMLSNHGVEPNRGFQQVVLVPAVSSTMTTMMMTTTTMATATPTPTTTLDTSELCHHLVLVREIPDIRKTQ